MNIPPPPMNSFPPAPQKPDSFLVALAKTAERLPAHAWGLLKGMLLAGLSDPINSSLVVGAALFGLATGKWLMAVAIVFLGYALLHTVSMIAGALGQANQLLAAEIQLRQQAAHPPHSAPPAE